MGHGLNRRDHRGRNIVGVYPAHDLNNITRTHDGQHAVDAQCSFIDRPLSLYLNTDAHCARFDLNDIEVSTQRVDKRLFDRHRSPFHAVEILRFESHSRCDLRKRQVGSATWARGLSSRPYPLESARFDDMQHRLLILSSLLENDAGAAARRQTSTPPRPRDNDERGKAIQPSPAPATSVSRASACGASRGADWRRPHRGAPPCSFRRPRSCPRTSTTCRDAPRSPPTRGCGWRRDPGTNGRV